MFKAVNFLWIPQTMKLPTDSCFLSVMSPSSPSTQCLQYKTDQAQDVKKIEKLQGKLMRLMVAKETHSSAIEMD